MNYRTPLLYLAAITSVSPTMAQAPPPALDCMASEHTASDLKSIDRFSGINQDGADEFRAKVKAVAEAAVARCAEKNTWPGEATEPAVMFETARLAEAAYRRAGSLNGKELRAIDAVLERKASDGFWLALERGFEDDAEIEDALSAEEQEVFVDLIVAIEAAEDEAKQEAVGTVLALMIAKRKGAREFQSAQGRRH